MSPRLFEVTAPSIPGGGRGIRIAVVVIGFLLLFAIGNPIKVIPAGHVGVKDFFGNVSKDVLTPGAHFVFPFTRVIRLSVQTQELKETADVPSLEGLIMDLEASLLYRLDPEHAAEIYKTVGTEYPHVVV